MAQLNIHVNPEFERSLHQLMRLREVSTKSEAVRMAVRECLERAQRTSRGTDYRSWIGLALKAPVNPRPQFSSDDDLWG